MNHHDRCPRARVRSVAVGLLLVLVAGLLAGCEPQPVTLTGTLSLSGGPAAEGVVVTAYSASEHEVIAQVVTDAEGRYRFVASVLPAGTYRLRFGDGSWWEGASGWGEASSVTVDIEAPTVVDATITEASATMGGTVTSVYDRTVAGATVEVLTLAGHVVASTTTDAAGRFDLSALSSSEYLVRISKPGHATWWHGGSGTPATATPIEVDEASAPIDLDVTLPPASSVTGAVRGTGDMAGLVAVATEAGSDSVVGRSTTDQLGRFAIADLPAGTYRIGIVDSTDRFAVAVLGAPGHDMDAGTPVTVTTGRSTTVGEIAVRGKDCPADSRNGQLAGHDFSGANLVGCDFAGAVLNGADLSGSDLTNANFSSAQLVGADLTGADLDGALFLLANLAGATLTGASTEGLNVRSANLADVDFGTDPLGRVSSGSVVGAPARLPSGWAMVNGYIVGPRAMLTSANLSGRDLSGRNLTGADLGRANLTGASLAGADLTGASLADAKLGGADLAGAILAGATLRAVSSGGITGTPAVMAAGWVLHAGRLFGERVDASGTDLEGVDLSGADLTGITSGGITGSPAALPTGWALVDGYLFGPAVTVQGADVGGADLSGVDLRSARTLQLTGTPSALPPGWTLFGGHLVGPGAQLQNAVLAGMSAAGMNLAGASFSGADLAGADLAGAALTNVFLTNANLTGADLTGANLTDANLTGADLAAVDLAGATILRVRSGSIQGVPASLPAARALANGFLLGPGAQLPSADLTGAQISGVDLSGANLVGAELDAADLTHAVLVGADLTRASIAGASVAGANLQDAVLAETSGQEVVGSPAALPTGWALVDGVLLDPFW